MKLSRPITVLLCVSALLIMAGLVHGEQPNQVDDGAQRNLLATSATSEADRHRHHHHHHHHNDYYHGYSSHRHYGRWHRMLMALKLKALDSEMVPSDGTAIAPAPVELMNTQQTAENPDQEVLEEESEKVEEIPTPEDIPTEGGRKLLKTNHGGYGNGWGYGHRHHDDYHGHGGYHHHDDHHHHGGHRSWRHWG